MRKLALILALIPPPLLGEAVSAQTVGTPVYMAPYRAFQRHEFGGMFSDPGSGFALEGAYRYGSGKFDIGFRGGFWSLGGGSDEVLFLLGSDLRFRVIDATADFPLDGAFTAGFGAAFGDNSVGYIPIGLSLGRRIELEDGGSSFVPYLHPVLAPTFGDDSDLLVSLGLGVDFKASRSLDIRVSGGLGDIQGIAIGLAWIR